MLPVVSLCNFHGDQACEHSIEFGDRRVESGDPVESEDPGHMRAGRPKNLYGVHAKLQRKGIADIDVSQASSLLAGTSTSSDVSPSCATFEVVGLVQHTVATRLATQPREPTPLRSPAGARCEGAAADRDVQARLLRCAAGG